MYWFAKWASATPETVASRLFRGDVEQAESLLGSFILAQMRLPASMQELLLWVDAEADEVRRDWVDGFNWPKFQEKIERKYAHNTPLIEERIARARARA